MVVHVLGRGYIEIRDEVVDFESFQKILSMMEDTPDEFTITYTDESVGTINFEMDGNKGIDYSSLDSIKDFLVKAKISFQIGVSEYVEGEQNYYFDSDDKE